MIHEWFRMIAEAYTHVIFVQCPLLFCQTDGARPWPLQLARDHAPRRSTSLDELLVEHRFLDPSFWIMDRGSRLARHSRPRLYNVSVIIYQTI